MHGCEYGGKRIWDDISGKELDWNGVLKARMEELEGFKKYKVYEQVSIEECRRRTGKDPLKNKMGGCE